MRVIEKLRTFTEGFARTFGRTPKSGVDSPPISDGHAPGHRHLGPPPEEPRPTTGDNEPAHDQPWIRTTHSDSQNRRFRR